MALFNRLLSVFILIAAVVAVVYSYKLDQKRDALVQHSEDLAAALRATAEELSVGSGTTEQTELSEAKIGWRAYSEGFNVGTGDNPTFKTTVGKAADQAKRIRDQRDALGVALKEVGQIFDKEVDLAQLTNIAEFEAAAAEIRNEVEASRRRENDIAGQFEKLALDVGFDQLDKDALMSQQRYQEAVGDFSDHVRRTNQRADGYVSAIKDITTKIDQFDFQMNIDMLDNPEQYEHELTALREDYASLNEQLQEFDRTQTELAEKEREFNDLTIRNSELSDNVAQLETQVSTLTAVNGVLEQRLQECTQGPDRDEKENPLDGTMILGGKVTSVNYEWNYVIIDIGARDLLTPSVEFKVARGTEFICNVKVSRVYEDYAVAEVLPELINGKILEGDRVIL